MLESTVETRLRRGMKRLKGGCYKFVSPGRRGVPDRICIWPIGEIDFVETKAPGKKPRADQAREHKRLRKLGCRVYVLDTPEKVDAYLRGEA